MTKWVDVDDSRYSRPVREGRPGLPPMERSVSAYDIPLRVGLSRDEASPNGLVISFDYLSPEPEIERFVSDTLRVKVGANSGRLRKAMVNLSSLLANNAQPTADEVANFISGQVLEYLKSATSTPTKLETRRFIPGQVLADNRRNVSTLIGSSLRLMAG